MFVVEFLDGDDVGLEGLQDADSGLFIGLAGRGRQVGRDDGEGFGCAFRCAGTGAGEQEDQDKNRTDHARKPVWNRGRLSIL